MAGRWSIACLTADIWSVKLLVWLLGKNGELLDSHLFLFDRYLRLAEVHRLRGEIGRAERCWILAEAHYAAAPDDDDEPEAAAMAMPIPRKPMNTNAISATRLAGRQSDESSGPVLVPAHYRGARGLEHSVQGVPASHPSEHDVVP